MWATPLKPVAMIPRTPRRLLQSQVPMIAVRYTYLELLRFFLNHRRFLRSRHAERQGKSPCELLTGHAHPHWLTLLGLGELQPRRV